MGFGLFSGIINTLYPSECPSCKTPAYNTKYAPFCSGCWIRIKKYSGPACNICSNPLVSEYATTCSECLKNPPGYSIALAFGLYEDVLAMAINTYKFHGIKRLSDPLGEFFSELDLPEADAILPVPLSISGLRERGFNQSLLLAKAVAKRKNMRLIIDGLRKHRNTQPQVGLSAKERISNLRGAFGTDRRFDNMRLLLVDDVITTGATVRECSRQLLKTGAKDVVVLALARASTL